MRDRVEAIVGPGPAHRPNWQRKARVSFALTEHNHCKVSATWGVLPNRLPGYRPVANAAARAEVEALWAHEAAI